MPIFSPLKTLETLKRCHHKSQGVHISRKHILLPRWCFSSSETEPFSYTHNGTLSLLQTVTVTTELQEHRSSGECLLHTNASFKSSHLKLKYKSLSDELGRKVHLVLSFTSDLRGKKYPLNSERKFHHLYRMPQIM